MIDFEIAYKEGSNDILSPCNAQNNFVIQMIEFKDINQELVTSQHTYTTR